MLPFDLSTEKGRSDATGVALDWVTEADTVHSRYYKEWNEVEDRLDTTYHIDGFSQEFGLNMARNNDKSQRPEVTRELVQVNRASVNHEATLGDFIATRRRLIVSGRTPQSRSIAKVYQRIVEYEEDANMLPEQIYVPTMDGSFSKGLHWTKVEFNPRANGLHGKFEFSDISVRDVLVDPSARGYYFKGAKYFIHRLKYSVVDAKRKFRAYSLFDEKELGADTDYDQPYRLVENTKRDYCTMYEIHFSELQSKYYQIVDANSDPQEIEEPEFLQLLDNPATKDTVFEGEQSENWFTMLYNKSVGVFSISENPFNQSLLVPLGNIFRESRLYPAGDIIIYKNLLDFIDVLVTVMLENAKKSNNPIVPVDPFQYEQFKDAVDGAIAHGGAAPGVTSVHYAHGMNEAANFLLQSSMGWIQDIASRHSASMGQVPSRQIAKETVQMLQNADRQNKGRKDSMVKWYLTSIVKLMVKMIGQFVKEPTFYRLMDAQPGQPGYIPVNQKWTEDEYKSNLAEIYSIAVPDHNDEQQVNQFAQSLAQAQKDFEGNNKVITEKTSGWLVQNSEMTDDDLSKMMQQQKLTKEQFAQQYDPQIITITVYHVNELNLDDADIDVTYEIDSDYKNNPQYKANQAIMLSNAGKYPTIDLYHTLDIPNGDEVYQRLIDENQNLAMAKQIAGDPRLMMIMQNAIQQIKESGSSMGGSNSEVAK